MRSGAVSAGKDRQRIFEAVLSSPGMSGKCKIVLQPSRQQVLLLSRLVEAGLLREEPLFEDEFLAALPKESLEEWRAVHGGAVGEKQPYPFL